MAKLMQRYSKQATAWEDLTRVLRALEKLQVRSPEEQPAKERRHKLDQRIDTEIRARMAADYESGISSNQLMVNYGLGKGTVLQVLREAGVVMRGQSLFPAHLDAAATLYATGVSMQMVSDHFGQCGRGPQRVREVRGGDLAAARVELRSIVFVLLCTALCFPSLFPAPIERGLSHSASSVALSPCELTRQLSIRRLARVRSCRDIHGRLGTRRLQQPGRRRARRPPRVL